MRGRSCHLVLPSLNRVAIPYLIDLEASNLTNMMPKHTAVPPLSWIWINCKRLRVPNIIAVLAPAAKNIVESSRSFLVSRTYNEKDSELNVQKCCPELSIAGPDGSCYWPKLQIEIRGHSGVVIRIAHGRSQFDTILFSFDSPHCGSSGLYRRLSSTSILLSDFEMLDPWCSLT